MPPVNVSIITRRIPFVEFNVADQSRAGVDRLNQVVTENRILLEETFEGLLKCIHIVNAFADKSAFVEEVLVNVRDGAGVGIDPGIAGKNARKPGSTRARQTNAHTRLQDTVAFANHAFFWVKLRPV